ncbi:histone-fold-containing protein [Malassezia pachydermatis]|uniref:DNA polymerase epsilon subunit D n=1 Tax=Malassezia pachydermatis TaxID=77020 RepID=A0A0M9VPR1_9BASI|nr:histone-fold-containing protein [Malassezia pachydermatis]KOS14709.1 histone-fold-containing protein [Malassezia pachydermatis]
MDVPEQGAEKQAASPVPNTVEAMSDSEKEDIPLSAKSMSATNAAGGTFGLGLDQFELPKASIAKVARSEIPESVQLRKDTITALVKSASVFVSYLTAASHDVAIARGNKTISAAHVLDAMRELDFPPAMRKELREQLEAYRDLQKKSAAARAEAAAQSRERAKAARAAAAAAAAAADAEAEAGGTEGAEPMQTDETGNTYEPTSATDDHVVVKELPEANADAAP